ncbi:MAG: hypothetical protein HIU92_19200 [Proteobacteria bacterium]|nr:hypothetical protein [Pseudomonadota bacterium]
MNLPDGRITMTANAYPLCPSNRIHLCVSEGHSQCPSRHRYLLAATAGALGTMVAWPTCPAQAATTPLILTVGQRTLDIKGRVAFRVRHHASGRYARPDGTPFEVMLRNDDADNSGVLGLPR